MKNHHLLAGLLVCFGFFITACESNAPESQYKAETLDLLAYHEAWNFDTLAQQYYYHFDVPQITAHVYNYGNWTLCREYFAGSKDAYQIALPQSEYRTDTLVSGDVAYYTRHIDYRLGTGYVEIQVTNSDYLYEAENPEDMHFRLQLIY